MKKLIIRIAFFAATLYIALASYILLFPMNYFSTDYAGWRYKMDIAIGKISPGFVPDTLVLGDSRAYTGIDPSVLGQSSVSLALDGSSVVEGYYLLKKYLNHNPAPRNVVVSYAPFHFFSHRGFSKRTLPFRLLPLPDLIELDAIMRKHNVFLHKPSPHFIDKSEWFLISPWLDNIQKRIPLSTLVRIDTALYYLGYPFKYQAELLNSGLFLRRGENLEFYKKMADTRGYHTYAQTDNSLINQEATVGFFQGNPVYTHYFIEMIKLCQDKGIRIIYITAPMNKVSYKKLRISFLRDYMTYLYDIRKNYPYLDLYTSVNFYSRDLFADHEHLNALGSMEFSTMIRTKYLASPRR